MRVLSERVTRHLWHNGLLKILKSVWPQGGLVRGSSTIKKDVSNCYSIYLAFIIFLGSSMGVGNDSGAGTVLVFSFSLKFGPRFVGLTRSGCPPLFLWLFCSDVLARPCFFSGFVVFADPTSLDDDWAKLRSIRIFLQTSRNELAINLWALNTFFKWPVTGLFFVYFRSLSNKHYNISNKLMWKMSIQYK